MPAASDRPEPIKVLLVEDDFEYASLIEEYLKAAEGGRFQALRAASLEGALKRIQAGGIDLILLDLCLPDSSGLGTLKRARAAAMETPIIVFTGQNDAHTAVDALREGAQDYLVKSKTFPEQLVRSIRYSLERRRAAAALRETQERYRQIVETAEEGIWMIDAEDKTTFINRRMAEMLGCGADEMLGRTIYDFMDEEGRAIIARKLEKRRGGVREQYDFKFRRKDGGDLWALVAANPVMDKNGRYMGALAMVTDITERKELESQFRQSQKMEAIGRLAGGVAHDFNNLLSAILGYSKLLEDDMDSGDSWLQDIREITRAANRAASLTKQLLAFSRRQILDTEALNLNDVVGPMENMLRRLIREDIELAISLDPSLENVKADAGQIEQVIMNLAVNAGDAMEHGGALTIETKNVRLEESSPGRHEMIPPGAYVMLAVSDQGCGMDADTQSHIFEPFFTTKGKGKGTGLGLSTVYGIVKQSGGYIWVYSEVGRGSVFKIYLLVCREAAQRPEREKEPAAALRGCETVLLVEDNDSIRRVIARGLKSNGYKALEARNGKEAIQILELQDKVDLILTDIVMPELDGGGLADYVMSTRPCVKVIFMSGYSDEVVMRYGEIKPGMLFAQKPIVLDALLRQMRYALDEIYTLDPESIKNALRAIRE